MEVTRTQMIIGAALILSLVTIGVWVGISSLLHSTHINRVKSEVEDSLLTASESHRTALSRGGDFAPFGIDHRDGKKMIAKADVPPTLSTHYMLEASEVDEDRYQFRAWPRAHSIKEGKVAAQMFYLEFDGEGKILARGWTP